MLFLAIASSSSDFRTQMRMAMAAFIYRDFHPEFPPRVGTLIPFLSIQVWAVDDD
jgi:hypothetical protein